MDKMLLNILVSLSFIVVVQGLQNANHSAEINIVEEELNIDRYIERNEDEAKSLPRCGQVLNFHDGGIYYKAMEQILPFERCVWVIGVPRATGYTINLQRLGTPFNASNTESYPQLIFTGVNRRLTMTTFRPETDGYFEILDANIVIVTFHSSMIDTTQITTGFALQYEAIYTGRNEKSANESSHHIIQSPAFDFKYPLTGSYADRELSAFLFPSSNNFYSGGQSNIFYERGGLESCLDTLNVYKFNVTQPTDSGVWTPSGRICNDITSLQISSDEIILVLFQTDGSVVASGFHMSFISC